MFIEVDGREVKRATSKKARLTVGLATTITADEDKRQYAPSLIKLIEKNKEGDNS